MKALDLFSCAGGAAHGLQLVGLDVTGVDIKPQPHNPADRFIQADALSLSIDFLRASTSYGRRHRVSHIRQCGGCTTPGRMKI